MDTTPIDRLTFAAFQASLNTGFTVRAGADRQVELKLVDARESPPTAGGLDNQALVQYESFSLTFTGPGEALLPQRMYSFEHERLGRFDLFIVPVAQTTVATEYQAVFNRRIN